MQTSVILKKQQSLLQAVKMPQMDSGRKLSWLEADQQYDSLNNLISVTDFYGNLISSAGAHTAKDAMKIVAIDIEKDGLHIGPGEHGEPP